MAKSVGRVARLCCCFGGYSSRVHGDWLESLTLLEGLSKQVPVYVVTGNHDIWTFARDAGAP